MMLFLVAGCSTTRQIGIDFSIEKIKNAEAIREIAQNCKTAWPPISGLTDVLIESRMTELPEEAIKAKKELDQLDKLPELSGYQLGRFLGQQIIFWGSASQTIIEKYAPDIIEYLPLIF